MNRVKQHAGPAITIALLLLLLQGTVAQVALAEPITWNTTGPVGYSETHSLISVGTTVYAGCKDGHVYSRTGAGGWTDTGFTGGTYIYALEWDGTDTLYAGSGNGDVYSRTGSGDWTTTGYTGGGCSKALAWNGTTLYSGNDQGYVYSWTGGGPWSPYGRAGYDSSSLAWDGSDTLYVGSTLNTGRVSSRTEGGSWTDYGDPTGNGYVNCLAWDGTDTLYAGCGYSHVACRTDGGSWTDLGATGGTTVISIALSGTTVYAGDENGHVYSKTGAGSWVDLGNTAGTNNYVRGLAWDGVDTIYAGCIDGRVYSKTGAGPWTDTTCKGGSRVDSLTWDGSDTIYGGCGDGHVYSKTGAGPWTDTGPVGTTGVYALAWDGSDTLYAGCGETVYAKTGGGPWADTGLSAGYSVKSLAWDGGDTLYAGSNGGEVYSRTGGGPWAATNLKVKSTYVSVLAWDGNNTLYAGCDNGYVYSRTGGEPWVSKGHTGANYVESLAWDGADTLYAGCSNGHVYHMTGANTWADAGETGGGYIDVYGLVCIRGNIYAACSNGHVYAKAGKDAWTDTGVTGGEIAFCLVRDGTDTLYAGCRTGVYSGEPNPSGTHTITASAGANGSINPSGAVAVVDGDDQTFTITPDEHYRISRLTVDGLEVEPVSSYTFTNVIGDHTISAQFRMITHTITVTQGANGAVEPPGIGTPPVGVITVNDGASQAFTIKPDPDYRVANVLVDGRSVGQVSTYTFRNVKADHTIKASFATGVSPNATWYLAEGSTAWGYSCYISIVNPNTTSSRCEITYMTSTGPVSGGTVTLAPSSQATVSPAEVVGAADFSTRVVSLDGKAIAVDRTMIWTGSGAGSGASSEEAHSSVGVTSPNETWFLAEGSSGWGFECWLLIQNPNARTANCRVTYMIEGEGPRVLDKQVPGNSRATFNMADDIGPRDASIKVTADVPVIPERAMYRDGRRAGHDSIGTTASAKDYFLAEGTTAWGFTTYVLVQNPNDTPVEVTTTYMTPEGPKAQPAIKMPANSRKTIRVNDIAEVSNTDFSTRVHGSDQIIAERAMYWNGGPDMGEACHDSIGMDSAHSTFFLPDGQTVDGKETWTLVQNPNDSAVTVEITYMTPDGRGNVTRSEKIPANSRRTFNMLEHSGLKGRAAIMVKSKTTGNPIMCERAMYWDKRGAGTNTIGGFSN